MKKKVLALIAILVVIGIVWGIVALIGNSNKNNNETMLAESDEQNNTDEIIADNELNNIETTDSTTNSDRKILIAYFSRAGDNYNVGVVEKGNTELMAENIVEMTGGDLFKIEPTQDYPVSYDEATEIAQEEQRNDARPQIQGNIEDFGEYDTIFIGYPIWYGDMPQIMYTFLESYDFSGKTVIPFNTHEGSGNSGTYNTIKSKLESANVLDGLAIRGSEAREDSSKTTIEEWLEQVL